MTRLSTPEYFWMRLLFALISVGLCFQGIIVLVETRGWDYVIPEGRVLEWAQVCVLTVAAVGLTFVIWRAVPEERGLFLLMFCLLIVAAAREFNNTEIYAALIPRKWVGSLLPFPVIATVLYVYRRTLPGSILRLTLRPSFILLLMGFTIVVVWAQTLAQRPLLDRLADRAVEESLEFAGYILIAFGIFEEVLAAYARTVVSLANVPAQSADSARNSPVHLRRQAAPDRYAQ